MKSTHMPPKSAAAAAAMIWRGLAQRSRLVLLIPLIALGSLLTMAHISRNYTINYIPEPQAPLQSYEERLQPLLQHLVKYPDAALAPVVEALLRSPPVSIQEARQVYSQHLAELDR